MSKILAVALAAVLLALVGFSSGVSAQNRQGIRLGAGGNGAGDLDTRSAETTDGMSKADTFAALMLSEQDKGQCGHFWNSCDDANPCCRCLGCDYLYRGSGPKGLQARPVEVLRLSSKSLRQKCHR